MNIDFAIDVSDIPRGTLLAALFNGARPQGLGLLQYTPQNMTDDEADRIISEREREYPAARMYVDYLNGRVMKVEINGKLLDPRLYDRDNGPGAAQRVVDEIRKAASC